MTAWGARVLLGIVALGVQIGGVGLAGTPFDHAPLDAVLSRVVRDGRVDYRTLLADQAALRAYVASAAAVDPGAWSAAEQLVFWMNVYNACVLQGVLERYPLRSVKDVRGFFDRVRYPVAGRPRTLNEIEAAGRALGDARLHFGLVCASRSCPPLRAEAYDATRLPEQLADQARQFLGDPVRGLRVEGSTLWASKIFLWYAGDFFPPATPGAAVRVTPQAFVPVVQPSVSAELLQALHGATRVRYVEYDWSLNDAGRVASPAGAQPTPR